VTISTPTAAIGGSLEAQDFNTDIYIPITTMRQRIGDFVYTRRGSSRTSEIIELNQITLRINSVANVPATADLVRTALTGRALRVDRDTVAAIRLAFDRGARTADGSWTPSVLRASPFRAAAELMAAPSPRR
jgi:putative ABC transport system permease protein